jgi:hypothetical protein
MKPWMHQSEIDMIISYLNPTHKMFEWGCGGSTLHFSKYVNLYRSVDHNIQWYKKIRPLINNNTELYHVDNQKEYTNYINHISNFADIYDAILIDGRERVRCAIKAKKYLTTTGVLFVHDFFNRPRYDPIFEFYELINGIKNTEQTLAVFKIK